jgi:hypothetical protein
MLCHIDGNTSGKYIGDWNDQFRPRPGQTIENAIGLDPPVQLRLISTIDDCIDIQGIPLNSSPDDHYVLVIESIQRPGTLYLDEDPAYIVTATYNTHTQQLDFEVWPANIFRDVLTPWPGGIQPTHYSTELAKHVFGHTRWLGGVHRKSFGVTHETKHQFDLFHMGVVCSCT